MIGGHPRTTPAPRRSRRLGVVVMCLVSGAGTLGGALQAQSVVTDADLVAASGARAVRVGPASGAGRIESVPLEVYVARVLAGEAEPQAVDVAYQALAVAIRTFALANVGRHARDGFDLCDGTHCQVPRSATPVTRRAAVATAGQVLTRNGEPAEVFYSASCGGYSESADQVWPGANLPYMPAARDDVHRDDPPWTFVVTLAEIQRALAGAGVEGRLRGVRVVDRSMSGRATRMQLTGMRPDMMPGDAFRAAIGAARLRSTAFSIQQVGASLRFTGRGYGHGVGMCVVGAGRWAGRGESAEAILSRYFPGLELTRVGRGVPTLGGTAVATATPRGAASPSRGGIVVEMDIVSGTTAADVTQLATRARDELGSALGTSVAPIAIRVHGSLDSFRAATGRPWWVSSVSDGMSIDLAPVSLLAQRDGVEHALRIAIAEVLVARTLQGRPAWVRVGAARYFGRDAQPSTPRTSPRTGCPSDAELKAAISAAAQRDAESRAESCFAREYARTGDWRAVR